MLLGFGATDLRGAVATAKRLLDNAEGSLDLAINTYFSEQGSQAGPPGAAARPDNVSQLREIVGSGPRDTELLSLLHRFNGSVERAADAFFTEAQQTLPSAQPEGRIVQTPSPRRRLRNTTAPSIRIHDSSSENDQDEAAEAEPAAPVPQPEPSLPLPRNRRSSFGRTIHPSSPSAARWLSGEAGDSSSEDATPVPETAQQGQNIPSATAAPAPAPAAANQEESDEDEEEAGEEVKVELLCPSVAHSGNRPIGAAFSQPLLLSCIC